MKLKLLVIEDLIGLFAIIISCGLAFTTTAKATGNIDAAFGALLVVGTTVTGTYFAVVGYIIRMKAKEDK